MHFSNRQKITVLPYFPKTHAMKCLRIVLQYVNIGPRRVRVSTGYNSHYITVPKFHEAFSKFLQILLQLLLLSHPN